MERFGTAKTVPYIQKNQIREVHLYIYTFSEVMHAKHKNLFARHYSRRFLLINFRGHMTKEVSYVKEGDMPLMRVAKQGKGWGLKNPKSRSSV